MTEKEIQELASERAGLDFDGQPVFTGHNDYIEYAAAKYDIERENDLTDDDLDGFNARRTR